MKIVIIHSLYRPYRRGGAEVIVDNLVQDLRHDAEVAVITLSPWRGVRSLIPHQTFEDGVMVYRFFALNIFSFINIEKHSAPVRLLWHVLDMLNIHSALVVAWILWRNPPKAVMTHNLKGIGYTIPMVLRLFHFFSIHFPHDIQLVMPSGVLLSGAEQQLSRPPIRLYAWITKKLFGSPTRVICASRYLKNFYTSHGFFKNSIAEVMPNPVPFITPPGGLRSSGQNEHIRFFSIGQLEPHKGVVLLLDVFSKIKNSMVRLHIVGTGSLEGKVQAAAKKDFRITYHGYLAGTEKESLFSKMHFCILPTLCYENSPTVVYESFALGIPIIVSDIGGAAELVKKSGAGYVIPPNDSAALCTAIERALHCNEYARFSAAARAAVANLSRQDYTKHLLALLS